MKIQQIDDETQFGQQGTDSSEEAAKIAKEVQRKFAEVDPAKVQGYILGWVMSDDDESEEANIHLFFGGTPEAKLHLMLALLELLQLQRGSAQPSE